ncbi:hypothetical protein Caci_1865 [Catenulispora acidiphila DSM 44928]|uniref:Uncharacterized protein n=1 Tax=Catenulispora acidiphila (strain DSM 44928 / JCM 14897 / NBRC 102108 / NRRL B-24433 / ID139908) TaxID=479433 RepID=C7QE94_CATAD|nr:hypothetical protein Caci_1865 [Catenulispora acidiphila DSM 44928]
MLDLPLSQGSEAFARLASARLETGVARAGNAPARLRLPAGGAARASFGSTPAVPRITRAFVANATLSPDSRAPSPASNGLTSADIEWFPHP